MLWDNSFELHLLYNLPKPFLFSGIPILGLLAKNMGQEGFPA
jgi:hypothetical protein